MDRITSDKVWKDYLKTKEYTDNHNLFKIVEENENFYDGRQWEGVKGDMPKPVINILQRVVKYMIATLSTNDVSVSIKPFSNSEEDERSMKAVAEQIEKIIEQARIKESSRLAIRNAAVDGSAYMLQSFNPDIKSGNDMGLLENQILDNTQVFFGNPYSNELQKQPYITVALRQHISQVRKEAQDLGVENWDDIRPDYSDDQPNDDSDDLVTVLLRFWKDKTVHFCKTTSNVMIIDDTDLGYERYPISCFGWDPVKNSYLYNSPMTPVIKNQIFINKCFAIAQTYSINSAFPKLLYDRNKADIKDIMDTTRPSAVAGIDMMGKFMDFIKAPDFSNQLIELVNLTIAQTKECMGVNDASLGNVSPDNTSAIIALQESSNVPLELQRQNYFEFWEDTVRNIIDIISVDYGQRESITSEGLALIDFSVLKGINYDLNVDIGSGSQYSEIAQVQTLDKLFQSGIINASTYIDSIPDKYIPNKNKILQYVQEAEQSAQPQAMPVA